MAGEGDIKSWLDTMNDAALVNEGQVKLENAVADEEIDIGGQFPKFSQDLRLGAGEDAFFNSFAGLLDKADAKDAAEGTVERGLVMESVVGNFGSGIFAGSLGAEDLEVSVAMLRSGGKCFDVEEEFFHFN